MGVNSFAVCTIWCYICEWDYIETTLLDTLLPSNDKGYNGTSDITDCFDNTYANNQAFSITFSGRNQSCVTFDFKGTNYRTFDYDVTIAQSSKETFENSDEYSFDTDFTLCDYSLIAILADGTESHCSGAGEMFKCVFLITLLRYTTLLYCLKTLLLFALKVMHYNRMLV